MKKLSLTTKTLIALVLGICFGLFLSHVPSDFIRQTIFIDGILDLAGTGFLNAIKLLVVPLVFVSITYATASLDEIKKVGRIGGKTFAFYLLTTGVAISLALLVANILKPGVGVDMSLMADSASTTVASTSPNLVDTLLDIIPSNIFVAFTEGNMLGIIFFSLLLGVSMTLVGKKAEPLLKVFEAANEVLLKFVTLIMNFAPIGVFALLSSSFATFGFAALLPLVKYAFGITLTLVLHLVLVYLSMLFFIGKLNPIIFLKKYFPVFSLCFSTSSSSASLPLSLKTSEEQFGVSAKVCSFTLPLGTTINMDGTAIMQGFAVVFIAQMYGIQLGLNDYVMIILTAVLASIGTAGVPGVGMVMLTMVLASVNLPLEAIGLLMGIDRILDMLRTTVNVAGDHVCTLLVAKSENELDESIYNSPDGISASKVNTHTNQHHIHQLYVDTINTEDEQVS